MLRKTLGLLSLLHVAAAAALSPEQAAQIDASAQEWLAASGAPSASIAVVQDGQVTYAHAYGNLQLQPAVAATTGARYGIGSISKEFTAAAVLLLAQQGELSLDDTVDKWFPDLGAASKVTLRQLLTHTSGVRDYWPQDFVPPQMLDPISVRGILQEWARRPLDFEPGTEWQYSNTGYVLAGAIVEKVSGQKLLDLLQRQVFTPLKMTRVTEDDTHPLPAGDAVPYTRQGLGPARRAPKEGAGWLFAAGELAMTPSDLALWDISLLNRSLLKPDSYTVEFTPVTLKDGTQHGYGLGLDIETVQGRKRIGHGGEVSGFLSVNRLWPDDKTAVVVLTNDDFASPEELLDRIAFVVLPPTAAERRARAVFAQYQQGTVDRALFTKGGNSLLTAQALADLQSSLGPLGPVRLMQLQSETKRGGMINRRWKVLCGARRLVVVERGYPGGKLEQFLVLQVND